MWRKIYKNRRENFASAVLFILMDIDIIKLTDGCLQNKRGYTYEE